MPSTPASFAPFLGFLPSCRRQAPMVSFLLHLVWAQQGNIPKGPYILSGLPGFRRVNRCPHCGCMNWWRELLLLYQDHTGFGH